MTFNPPFPLGLRVRILDVTGLPYGDTGYEMKTPEVSQPYVNQEGTLIGYADIRDEKGDPVMIANNDGPVPTVEPLFIPIIEMGDGFQLLGSECWWSPVSTP